MFKWLNKQGVVNDRGIVVQSVSRSIIEYCEGEKTVSIEVESGRDDRDRPCMIISSNAFERWDGESESHTLRKQQEMIEIFREAMDFQGLAVVIN